LGENSEDLPFEQTFPVVIEMVIKKSAMKSQIITQDGKICTNRNILFLYLIAKQQVPKILLDIKVTELFIN
jgi:hypothetical protein